MDDIWIVDDEILLRTMLRRYAQMAVAATAIRDFANAEEALAALQRERPKLLISDNNLAAGGMKGIELIRHARKLYPDLRIIFQSSQEDLTPAAEKLGARVVVKPYEPGDMIRAIKEWYPA
jgi:DNA-binding NtrC family response regulator